MGSKNRTQRHHFVSSLSLHGPNIHWGEFLQEDSPGSHLFVGGGWTFFQIGWITHHRGFRSNLWWIYSVSSNGKIFLFSGTKTAAWTNWVHFFRRYRNPKWFLGDFPPFQKKVFFGRPTKWWTYASYATLKLLKASVVARWFSDSNRASLKNPNPFH